MQQNISNKMLMKRDGDVATTLTIQRLHRPTSTELTLFILSFKRVSPSLRDKNIRNSENVRVINESINVTRSFRCP